MINPGMQIQHRYIVVEGPIGVGKTSLVKKEMRVLRVVAGDDTDAAELLDIALHCSRKRVVVKRPRLAPILGDAVPSHAITGKTSRFDVYLI